MPERRGDKDKGGEKEKCGGVEVKRGREVAERYS